MVRHAPRELNTGLTNTVAREIKDGKYAAVIAEMIVPGVHVAPPRHHAAMHQLCAWALLCIAVGIPMVIIGSFGAKWTEPQVTALISDGKLTVAHHRMCHFGVKVDPTAPLASGACVVTASTVPLPAHPCRCSGGPRANHSSDFKTEIPINSKGSGPLFQLKHKAHVLMAKNILHELALSLAKGQDPPQVGHGTGHRPHLGKLGVGPGQPRDLAHTLERDLAQGCEPLSVSVLLTTAFGKGFVDSASRW